MRPKTPCPLLSLRSMRFVALRSLILCLALGWSALACNDSAAPLKKEKEEPPLAAPFYIYDLDADGENDANVEGPGPCAEHDRPPCLRFLSQKHGDVELPLDIDEWQGLSFMGLIGKHFDAPLQSLVVYATHRREGKDNVPILKVFDLARREEVAWVQSPLPKSYDSLYFGVIRGPTGVLYPFLSAGGESLQAPHWDTLCIFDPSRIGSVESPCQRGFRPASLAFHVAGQSYTELSPMRHSAGWIEDVDDDGWQDIHLPHMGGWLLSISGRDGSLLTVDRFNPHPDPNEWFHGGRIYASIAPFPQGDGRKGLLIVAGNPVGDFSFQCNVSRYVALLDRASGTAARQLRFSEYFSYGGPVYRSPPAHAADFRRPPDYMHRCIHRVSDSLDQSASGQAIAIYNWFYQATAPPDTCLDALFAREIGQGGPELYYPCVTHSWPASEGYWNVDLRDLSTGQVIKTWPNVYLWGRSRDLLPSGERVFLLEGIPSRIAYDRRNFAGEVVRVVKLDAQNDWVEIGRFPSGRRPAIVGKHRIEGESGGGDYLGEIVEADIDGDGLKEVRLHEGGWVGFDRQQGIFIEKTPPD